MSTRFRAALAFLGPNAWGPLMVGIAASGVFADFALRPMVESGVNSACSQVATDPELAETMGVQQDGVCKNYFRREQANRCLSQDGTTLEYAMRNADGTLTKWVAKVDPTGKISALKELALDPETSNVVKAPVEYRFSGEDLTEVRPTPVTSIRSEVAESNMSQEWASYLLIASIMRTAVTSCKPGKYDELLRSAQKALQNSSFSRSFANYRNNRGLRRTRSEPTLRSSGL